jgi:hypothetical protein
MASLHLLARLRFSRIQCQEDDDLRVDLRVDLRPPVLLPVLRDEDLRVDFLDVRLRGTFSPFSLASLIPIAIACLRLVTLRPPRVFSLPCLLRRIALPTVELAFLLYFRPDDFRPELRVDVLRVEDFLPDRDALRAAISNLPGKVDRYYIDLFARATPSGGRAMECSRNQYHDRP